MSTKTEKFNLHQWAPTDNFLREEINENFAKLDTGALKVKVGSFMGTGQAGYEVDFGVKPKVVFLFNWNKPGNNMYLNLNIMAPGLVFRHSEYMNHLSTGDDYFMELTETGVRFLTTDLNMAGRMMGYIVFY